jgi:hypothetical protein
MRIDLKNLVRALPVLFASACTSTPKFAAEPVPKGAHYEWLPSEVCPNSEVSSDRYAATQYTDAINGYVTFQSSVATAGDSLTSSLSLSLSGIRKPPERTDYSLHVVYTAKNWLLVDPSDTVTIIALGRIIHHFGQPSVRRETSFGGIRESLLYRTTPGEMDVLATARTISVRIRGRRGSEDFQLPPDVMCTFRRFAVDVLSRNR